MGIRRNIMRVGMVLALILADCAMSMGAAHAGGAAAPQLLISQFKITSSDGQFFTLYNASTTPIDLSGYELEYFNNNDLTKATSSKILPLSGMLPAGAYYMLSDGAAAICYQVTVDTVSLGFSTTAGFAELLQLPPQSTAGTVITPTVVDYASWTKKTASNKDTLTITSTGSTVTAPTGTGVTWLRQQPVPSPGGSAWQPVQPAANDPCTLQLLTQTTGTPTGQSLQNPGQQLGSGQEAPSSIVSLAAADDDTDNPVLPSADVGLAAPQVTELLPNPNGTGNDDTDEFIELYNPNPVTFDLTGFVLQTGATTKHSYVFPDGSTLKPQAFIAFFSADTGLSLSNSNGQADLLDPFGNVLSKTDIYSTAKDGQTWALAKGKWYWTSAATPNAANVIKQAATTAKKTTKSSSAASKSAGAGTASASTSSSTTDTGDNTGAVPLHPLVLAAVGVAAVGYGIYEYRHDIANKLHELRRNRKSGRAPRLTAAGR